MDSLEISRNTFLLITLKHLIFAYRRSRCKDKNGRLMHFSLCDATLSCGQSNIMYILYDKEKNR